MKIEKHYIGGLYPRAITAFSIEDALRMSKQLLTLFERKTFRSITDSSNRVKSQFKKGTNCETIFRSRKFFLFVFTDCMRLMAIFLLSSFTLTKSISSSQATLNCGGFRPRRVTKLTAELKNILKLLLSKKQTNKQKTLTTPKKKTNPPPPTLRKTNKQQQQNEQKKPQPPQKNQPTNNTQKKPTSPTNFKQFVQR